MKKIIYSLMLLIVILSSCKKKDVIQGNFTIKGHFYTDCNKIPIKNYPLLLRNYYFANNYPKYVTLAADTTDDNGYFEFKLSNPENIDQVYISSSSGIRPGFLNEIPIQNIDSLEVFFQSTCNINIKLNVIKTYTTSDTLEINDITSSLKPKIKIAGPFKSGLLYNAPKYNILTAYYDKNLSYDSSNYIRPLS